MPRQENSFQGQKIGLVSRHFHLQFCILFFFSKENTLNHNHKATRVQTAIMKRTRFKIYCAFHPIMSNKRPTSCSNTTEAVTSHSFPQHNNTPHSFLWRIPTKLGYVLFYRHVLNNFIAFIIIQEVWVSIYAWVLISVSQFNLGAEQLHQTAHWGFKYLQMTVFMTVTLSGDESCASNIRKLWKWKMAA